jgi:hypothetical protein
MKKIALVIVGVCILASLVYAQDAVQEPVAGEEAAVVVPEAAEVPLVPEAAEVFEPAEAFEVPEVPEVPTATETQEMVLKGVLIDNLCAEANRENLTEFIKTHPKSCAIKPDCAASGYSFITDGMIMKFDADSNVKVYEFLAKEDSTLRVEVVVKKAGEELSLVSIANLK